MSLPYVTVVKSEANFYTSTLLGGDHHRVQLVRVVRLLLLVVLLYAHLGSLQL